MGLGSEGFRDKLLFLLLFFTLEEERERSGKRNLGCGKSRAVGLRWHGHLTQLYRVDRESKIIFFRLFEKRRIREIKINEQMNTEYIYAGFILWTPDTLADVW